MSQAAPSQIATPHHFRSVHAAAAGALALAAVALTLTLGATSRDDAENVSGPAQSSLRTDGGPEESGLAATVGSRPSPAPDESRVAASIRALPCVRRRRRPERGRDLDGPAPVPRGLLRHRSLIRVARPGSPAVGLQVDRSGCTMAFVTGSVTSGSDRPVVHDRGDLLERSRQLTALHDASLEVVRSGAGAARAGRRRGRQSARPRCCGGSASAPRAGRGPVGSLRSAVHPAAARPACRHRRGARRRARGAPGRAARRPYEVAARSLRELRGARADRHRARGSALGRRGDARRPAPARPPAASVGAACSCSPPTATTSSRARTRCGSCSASSRAARGRPPEVAPLSAAAVGELAEPHGVDAAELHRAHGGQPVLRHRGARRRRRATSRRPCATRCSPGPPG